MTNKGKIYSDARGWKYRVSPGLSGNSFKPFFCKAGKHSYHACRQFEWRQTFAEAEADLEAYAAKRGWQVIEEETTC